MNESTSTSQNAGSAMYPPWCWGTHWTLLGGIGGWLGFETLSWLGWGLAALATVGMLSLSETVRWWKLSRREGYFSWRFLVGMVGSFGILGGLALSLACWPLALVIGDFLARTPGIRDHIYLRSAAGAALAAALFCIAWIAQRRQRLKAKGESKAESD